MFGWTRKPAPDQELASLLDAMGAIRREVDRISERLAGLEAMFLAVAAGRPAGSRKEIAWLRDSLGGLETYMGTDDDSVRWLLREADRGDLLIALKRGRPALVERILAATTPRVAAMLREDLDLMDEPTDTDWLDALRVLALVVGGLRARGRIQPDGSGGAADTPETTGAIR